MSKTAGLALWMQWPVDAAQQEGGMMNIITVNKAKSPQLKHWSNHGQNWKQFQCNYKATKQLNSKTAAYRLSIQTNYYNYNQWRNVTWLKKNTFIQVVYLNTYLRYLHFNWMFPFYAGVFYRLQFFIPFLFDENHTSPNVLILQVCDKLSFITNR